MRGSWLVLASVLLFCVVSQAQTLNTFEFDGATLMQTRERYRAGDASAVAGVKVLLSSADKKLEMTNPSVMDKVLTPPSGSKHDYASLSPYWWPDPSKPDGKPYMRKDGEVNPERDKTDQPVLEEMSSSCVTLALAYYFTGDDKYGAKSASMMRTWFFDDATKMNPNVTHAQFIPGYTEIRPYGVIETNRLRRILDAEALLTGSKHWSTDEHEKLKAWFKEFYNYLITSEQGQTELHGENNHGTWAAVQFASYALYLDDKEAAKKLIEEQGKTRIAKQIEPDGKQPHELERTKAFDYSRFNLEALENLAALGQRVDVDLWNFKTEDGRSIRAALDWMAPYAAGEKEWDYKQISAAKFYDSVRVYRLAANALNDAKYEQIAKKAAERSKVDPGDRITLLHPPKVKVD